MKTVAAKFKEIDNTAKYIGIGLLATLVLGYFVYKKGKSNGQSDSRIDHVPLPKEKGQLTSEEANTVREISLKLYDSLKGFGNIFRDETPFKMLAKQPDRIFIAIYNDFNTMYAKEGSGTLRNWIKDDYYQSGTDVAAAVIAILDRMDVLNLR